MMARLPQKLRREQASDAASGGNGAGTLRLRRGRWSLLAGAAVALAAIGVVAVIAATSGGAKASSASPLTTTATAKIVRQDLVERDSEDGTLGYADSRDVVNHLSGYVTWLPSAGDVVHPNHALYKVDGQPVILMNGTEPAYRTLSYSSSAKGRDVWQLERDLRALGYDSAHAMKIDGVWTSTTTTAVERWQKAHRLGQTGSIELGRLVFQPGARRIASVDATLGGSSSSGGSGGAQASAGSNQSTSSSRSSGASTQNASYSVASHGSSGSSANSGRTQTAFASYRTAHAAQSTDTTTTPTDTTTTPTTTAPTPTTPTTTTPTPKKKAAPKVKEKPRTRTTSPQRSSASAQTVSPSTPSGAMASGARASASSAPSSGTSAGGGGAGTGTTASPSNTILSTTSTRKIVTVNLDTTKSELAKLGASVSVQLPSGKYVKGRIIGVGKVATKSSSSSAGSSSSSSSTATIEVTIQVLERGTALDQAPVTVSFEQSRVKNALTIPVTALIARPGGRFAVEVVERTTRRLVSVTPGSYTSGYVQISGAGLQPGMRVTNAAVE